VLLTWSPSNGLQAVVALSPQAWYRYGIGITVTGAGVSTWADQSGNGRDLLQGTDAARPSLEADGSILFNGTSHFLQTAGFTYTHPFTWYLLGRQITWTSNDHIFNGVAQNTATYQEGTTPQIQLFPGTAANNGDWTLGIYAPICVIFNAASSLIRIGNNAPTTGDTGDTAASDPGGFTLSAANSGAGGFSNIQVKEIILYSGAHTTTQQSQIMNYLSRML